MIVLDEDDRGPAGRFLADGRCEAAIGRVVVRVIRRAETSATRCRVTQRPEPFVGKAAVVARRIRVASIGT